MPIISYRTVVSIKPGLNDLVRSSILSQLKMSTITDTFLQRNSEFARYRSSMIGDIAKLCAKAWLENQGFEVVDWDDVRTSWRSSRKPFDLEVNGCKIEIASSLDDNENGDTISTLNRIIHEKSIIQPVRRTEKDVVMQLYYLAATGADVHFMAWANWRDLLSYRSIRYVAGHPRDFYLMPFSSPQAKPPRRLVDFLRRLAP